MDWTPVRSTHLSEIAYDEESQVLSVRFQDGAEYEYIDVPRELVDTLRGAGSIGIFFSQHIRKAFAWRRVG